MVSLNTTFLMTVFWALNTITIFTVADPIPFLQPSDDELLLTIEDEQRDRSIPIKIYIPDEKKPVPVILFSHGLGGSRHNNSYLGTYWAENGYLGVFMQHPGSDADILKYSKLGQRFTALKSAANLENSRARVQDVRSVIDQLETWNQTEGHPLAGRLDLEHIGMSGHSFGAVTTVHVAGYKSPLGRSMPDERITAFIAMSPQPGRGRDPKAALREIRKPMLCMTGTEDRSPINRNLTPDMRKQVYECLPDGDKFQLVLKDAGHMAFSGGRTTRKRTRSREPKYHSTIQKISVRFWDAYLKKDKKSLEKLKSKNPLTKESLAPGDSWEWK